MCCIDRLKPQVPSANYLRIVFPESFVRLAISRIDTFSRTCQRLITLNNATSITPISPALQEQVQGLHVGHN